MPVHVSSTYAHHQEVKIALHSLWYHHTYRCRCDDTRGCAMQMGLHLENEVAVVKTPTIILNNPVLYKKKGDT